MTGTVFFDSTDAPSFFLDATKGRTKITEIVPSEAESPLAAGFVQMEEGELRDYELTYHDFFYIIEGEFRITADGEHFRCTPGTAIYLPAGITVSIEVSSPSRLVYVAHPANWKELGNWKIG